MSNLHMTAILNRVKQEEKWKLPVQKHTLHLPKVGKSTHTVRRHSSSVTTPKSNKTYFRSPSSNSLYLGTPLRNAKSTPRKRRKDKTPKTPTDAFDRFIPSRSSMNTEMAHYMIVNNENLQQDGGTKHYSEKLNTALFNGINPSHAKVLSFTGSQKTACRRSLEQMYTTEVKDRQKSGARQIYPHPERILDAPELLNNFSPNLFYSNGTLQVLSCQGHLWGKKIKSHCPKVLSSISRFQSAGNLQIYAIKMFSVSAQTVDCLFSHLIIARYGMS